MSDPLLSDIVASVEQRATSELAITLMVHGTVITGTLISTYAYTKALIAQMKAIPAAADDGTPTQTNEAPATEYDVPDQYIHLRDVQVLMTPTPLTFPADQVGMWRIRLTDVNGWMFGRARLG